MAIDHLHTGNSIYRDLKPSNIALTAEGHVKLIDFGLCKEGMKKDDTSATFCGSIAYLAPEMIKKSGHSRALD